MKKLNKRQIKDLRDLVLNKNGSTKVALDPAVVRHFAAGSPLTEYKDGGFKKSAVGNGAHNLVIAIFSVLGYKIISGNDAPRGGILGNYKKLARKNPIDYPQIVALATRAE